MGHLPDFVLFSTRIRVQYSYFLMAAILAWPMTRGSAPVLATGAWLLVLTVSILLHEAGHAVAMRSLGCKPWIELYALGGLAHWGSDVSHTTRRDRIIVSLAGPCAGLLFGTLCLAVGAVIPPEAGSLWSIVHPQLLWANLYWSLFNLLPVLPLDGGAITEELFSARSAELGAIRARLLSVILGTVLCLVALGYQRLWVAFLLARSAQTSYQQLQMKNVSFFAALRGWLGLQRGASASSSLDVDVNGVSHTPFSSSRETPLEDLSPEEESQRAIELLGQSLAHCTDPVVRRQLEKMLEDARRSSKTAR